MEDLKNDNSGKKQVKILPLLSITFFATSLALLDFQNPEWSGNEKSYIGLIAGIVLLIISWKKNIH